MQCFHWNRKGLSLVGEKNSGGELVLSCAFHVVFNIIADINVILTNSKQMQR